MIKEILTSNGRSLVQGALGWIWARNDKCIPIPGFKDPDQVEENASSMLYGLLEQQQMRSINDILTR
jgi:aryl-alcohol dehydrogenase-like predicted oxidoreductase